MRLTPSQPPLVELLSQIKEIQRIEWLSRGLNATTHNGLRLAPELTLAAAGPKGVTNELSLASTCYSYEKTFHTKPDSTYLKGSIDMVSYLPGRLSVEEL